MNPLSSINTMLRSSWRASLTWAMFSSSRSRARRSGFWALQPMLRKTLHTWLGWYFTQKCRSMTAPPDSRSTGPWEIRRLWPLGAGWPPVPVFAVRSTWAACLDAAWPSAPPYRPAPRPSSSGIPTRAKPPPGARLPAPLFRLATCGRQCAAALPTLLHDLWVSWPVFLSFSEYKGQYHRQKSNTSHLPQPSRIFKYTQGRRMSLVATARRAYNLFQLFIRSSSPP